MAGAVEFAIKARDEATKTIQKVSGELGGLSKVAGSVFSGAGGGVGMVVAGMTALVAGTVAASKGIGDFAETLDRQSKSAGTSAANMQAMKLAFENAGLSGDDAAKALGFLNKNIAQGSPYLKQLGITTKDAYEAFQQLGAAFEGSDDVGKKTVITQMLLGKGMRANVGYVSELARETTKNVGVLAQYGATMDDVAMKNGLQLDSRMDSLHTRFVAASTSLGEKLTPALIAAMNAMSDFIDTTGRALNVLSELDKKNAEFNEKRIPKTEAERNIEIAKGFLAKMPKMLSAHGSGSGGDSLGKVNTHQKVIGYDENGEPIYGDPGGKKKSGNDFLSSVNWGAETSTLSGQSKYMAGLGSNTDRAVGLRGKSPSAKAIDDMMKSLKEVEIPAIKVTETMRIMAARADGAANMLRGMEQSTAQNISNMVGNVISGTQSIGDAFSSMVEQILSDLAAKAAEYGVGMFLSTFGGPVGAVGAIMMGGSGFSLAPSTPGGAASAAGNTYIINSIDAKSVVQSLVSPTGSMRRANDRVRDVRAAR